MVIVDLDHVVVHIAFSQLFWIVSFPKGILTCSLSLVPLPFAAGNHLFMCDAAGQQVIQASVPQLPDRFRYWYTAPFDVCGPKTILFSGC